MGAVENLVELLGEENQEKIKSELTDFIIQECKDEINSRDFYLIQYHIDQLMEDVYREIFANLKSAIEDMCTKRINEQFDEIVQKLGV